MSGESTLQVGDGARAPLHDHAHIGRFMAPLVEALVATGVRFGDAVLVDASGTEFAGALPVR